MFGSLRGAGSCVDPNVLARTGAAWASEMVEHRPGVGPRRTVEADLADTAEQVRADRRIAEVIPGDAIVSVGEVLGVDREAPGFARRGEGNAGVDDSIGRLIGH